MKAHLVLGFLVLSGCVAKSTHDDLWKEQIDCRSALAEARKELVTLRDQSKTIQERSREVELRNEELAKTNQLLVAKNRECADQSVESQQRFLSLREEKERVLEKMAFAGKTYDDLIHTLKEEIKEGQIRIAQTGDRLTVNVSDQVLFASGSAQVQPKGKAVLRKVVGALKEMDDKRILVEGHTDNVPISGALKERFPSNWDLSAARATQVVRYLEEQGVNPKRLTASGRGEHQPLTSNATPEGRKQNRRIEIVLLPMTRSE